MMLLDRSRSEDNDEHSYPQYTSSRREGLDARAMPPVEVGHQLRNHGSLSGSLKRSLKLQVFKRYIVAPHGDRQDMCMFTGS